MKLIVGLGNPGVKYQNNRHNIGFLVIDYLIDQFNPSKLSSKFKGELYKTHEYLFLKPLTFMNLSGESVKLVKDFYKINNDDIIVIHDDIDLNIGALKFKKGGSNGGHNGLKSIDKLIENDYWRIRIGVGRPERKEQVVSYVLSDFEEDEFLCVKKNFENIKKSIKDIKNAALKFSKKKC